MLVVLMRHAKAVPGQHPERDFERSLSVEGRRAFEALMPQMKEALPQNPVTIWTSPAARAEQTTHVLTQHLQVSEVQHYSWIYEGDDDAFSSALAGTMTQVLLVVGHQPTLSQWAKGLSGLDVAFKTGGMAAFEVAPGAQKGASLRWLIRAYMQEPA